MSASRQTPTAADPIVDELRTADRDRYDTAMLAPEPARGRLLTLYALNLELARTPWRVSEPQLGAMRLQWWADLCLAAETGEIPRGNPLVERVGAWIEAQRPPQARLRALIEARLRELDATPMESQAACDAFLEGTAGQCLALAAWAADGGRDDPARDAAAAALGYAQGAAGLLRAIPAYAAQERLMIPPTAGAVIPLADVARGETPTALREACAALATRGLERLATARAGRAAVSAAAAPAFLAAWRAEAALRAALKPDFDAFRDLAPESEFRRRASLTWAGLTGW